MIYPAVEVTKNLSHTCFLINKPHYYTNFQTKDRQHICKAIRPIFLCLLPWFPKSLYPLDLPLINMISVVLQKKNFRWKFHSTMFTQACLFTCVKNVVFVKSHFGGISLFTLDKHTHTHMGGCLYCVDCPCHVSIKSAFLWVLAIMYLDNMPFLNVFTNFPQTYIICKGTE